MWGRVAMLVFGMTMEWVYSFEGNLSCYLSKSFLLCLLALYLKKNGSLTW